MPQLVNRLSDQLLGDKNKLRMWGQRLAEATEAQLADIEAAVADIAVAQADILIALNIANANMPDVASIALTANSAGTIDPSSQLPKLITFTRYNGAVNVSTSSTWTRTNGSGITGTIGAATGVYTLTAATKSGTITATSVHNGITLSRTITVTKTNAPPSSTGSSGGGTTASDSSFTTINSTTPAAITDTLTVTVGTAGNVTLSAPLNVSTAAAFPTGTFEVSGQWYRTTAGAVALGTLISSDPDADVADLGGGTYDAGDGTLTVNHTDTGLAAASVQTYELRASNGTGTRVMSFSGTASAVG